MIIGLTLAIMFVITIFSIILGNSLTGLFLENIIDNNQIINGTTDYWGNPVNETTFGLDPITGGIALVVALVIVGAAIGITFIGSGLSDSSQRIILIGVFYIGIWVILSLLSSPLIVSIEIFGLLFYLTLTIAYAYGVVGKYFGTGN